MSSTTTGRWSRAEHAAFEEGLRRFGVNWRMIQKMVPSRNLLQIRTHAQKYFLRRSGAGSLGRQVFSRSPLQGAVF